MSSRDLYYFTYFSRVTKIPDWVKKQHKIKLLIIRDFSSRDLCSLNLIKSKKVNIKDFSSRDLYYFSWETQKNAPLRRQHQQSKFCLPDICEIISSVTSTGSFFMYLFGSFLFCTIYVNLTQSYSKICLFFISKISKHRR